MAALRLKRGRALLAWLIVLGSVGTCRADVLTQAFVDRLATPGRGLTVGVDPAQDQMTCVQAGTAAFEFAEVEEPRSGNYLGMMALALVIPPVLNPVEVTPFIKPVVPTPKPSTDTAHIQSLDAPGPKTDGTPPADAPEPASLILGLLGCGVGGVVTAVKRRRQARENG